ncbi:MAG: hypothetical protein E7016_00520 [Alphaproteobacteria bacterium]|nr:hypothetical protein [Alphaproteobacteria bacterium]
MKKIFLISTFLFSLASCTYLSEGKGQVIYHWERTNTGAQKFSRDHSECMRIAEDFKFLPNIKNWLYSEEARYDIRADWHAEKGIWASYIPYEGAQPILVNSIRDDAGSSPRKYRNCMEKRGYNQRTHNLPEVTNIFVYKPQDFNQDTPFEKYYR